MRFSYDVEDERTSDKNNKIDNTGLEFVDEKDVEFIDEEEEITGKIPIEKFCQINNAQFIFDEPMTLVKILLLKSKTEYKNYYGKNIYAIYLKSENEEVWFGVPVKNPNLGLIKFEKSAWDEVYRFSLALTMQENV